MGAPPPQVEMAIRRRPRTSQTRPFPQKRRKQKKSAPATFPIAGDFAGLDRKDCLDRKHMNLPKFTFGMGDRFAHEGVAQLEAIREARAAGAPVYPVWNKSFREHSIVKSSPSDLRREADAAVKQLGWGEPYFVDADHVRLETVDGFMAASDFFTLDVADFVNVAPEPAALDTFLDAHKHLLGEIQIPGIAEPIFLTEADLRETAGKFLAAAAQAGKIYRHIAAAKGEGNFITEVSVDETDSPQTPRDLLLILSMLAAENIPAQTVAPKFTGRFNKGVDYVGDLAQFEKEFEEDLCVIKFAIREFGLPADLKLSVHSGSDKFAIYPAIKRQLAKHGAGVHVKTAGTTWLEELIGLAEAGGGALAIAKEIYAGAHARFDELTGPYSTVIDIDPAKLPAPETVNGWSPERFADSLRHVQSNRDYNPHFRQLLHVGFKVAAEMGSRYTECLRDHEPVIARNVKENLLNRHLLPIFG